MKAKNEKDPLETAKKDFKKTFEEVKPFIKKKKAKKYSTAGQWKSSE